MTNPIDEHTCEKLANQLDRYAESWRIRHTDIADDFSKAAQIVRTASSLQERIRKLEERVAQLTDWLMEVAPSRVSQEAIDMVSADSAMRSLNDARSGAGE